jgi:hypothetical protein
MCLLKSVMSSLVPSVEEDFFDQLKCRQFLKNDFVLWSYLLLARIYEVARANI